LQWTLFSFLESIFKSSAYCVDMTLVNLHSKHILFFWPNLPRVGIDFIAAKGSLLFLTLCIHSPQSFARVMYCQNLDFWEDVCAKYSGGAYSKDVCKFWGGGEQFKTLGFQLHVCWIFTIRITRCKRSTNIFWIIQVRMGLFLSGDIHEGIYISKL
jgi:hypothetical protein